MRLVTSPPSQNDRGRRLMRMLKLMSVVCGFWVGCYRSAPDLPPATSLTWEQFEFELQCAEALGLGIWHSMANLKCRRLSFDVIAEAARNAGCVNNDDCEAINSWPPIGPCWLATSSRWKQKSFYRLSDALVESCGFMDRICPEKGEAWCIQGVCRIAPHRPMVLPPGVTCSPQMVQAHFSDAGVRPYWEAAAVTPGDAGTAGPVDAGLPDSG